MPDSSDPKDKRPIDKTPEKITVKPIDVLNEIETVPNPFTMALLDEKIGILKDKEKLIKQDYSKREVSALIERLEAPGFSRKNGVLASAQ